MLFHIYNAKIEFFFIVVKIFRANDGNRSDLWLLPLFIIQRQLLELKAYVSFFWQIEKDVYQLS